MASPTFQTDFGKNLDIGQDGGDPELKGIFSTPGRVIQRRKPVAFPGVHGQIFLNFGVNARDIVWSGTVWGSSHSTLNLIDKDIEDLIKSCETGTMTDQQGRSIKNCIVKDYQRVSPRERSGNGFVQDFVIVFAELTP